MGKLNSFLLVIFLVIGGLSKLMLIKYIDIKGFDNVPTQMFMEYIANMFLIYGNKK